LILGIGSKLKALLPLLKLGKFGGTILSMLVSVGAYAFLFPWQFAVGFVILIFVHEMGHVFAAKRKGLPVSAPTFIPFMGALITLKRHPQDAETEAYVAFGGPILGTVGALLTYWLGVYTGNPLFYGLAWTGFAINLFNLVPIHPLDGGRIVTAITRWLWILGLILGVVLMIYLRSWLLLFILVLFVFELWGQIRPKGRKVKRYITLSVPEEPFFEHSVMLPGEEHRRELPFYQYCDIETKEHYLAIEYPGLGILFKKENIEDKIHKVELIRTRLNEEDGKLHMQLELTMTPAQQIAKELDYYRITTGKRLLYGLAYVGLAAFLGYMMWFTHAVIQSTTAG
jgi:Zn-dependent protease